MSQRPDPLQLAETGDREAERQLVHDAYFDGYDAGLEDARRWGWRRPQPSGFLYALLAVALVTGLVVGYLFGAMSVSAAPRPGDQHAVSQHRASTDESPVDVGRRTGEPPSEVRLAAPLELAGVATWYCGDRCTAGYGPEDLVAAAGPEVRRALGSSWRGATVTACSMQRRCVDVALVDWCACAARRGVATLLDLSSGAFRHLAPLSAGVVEVRVRLDPR
jgi:hypothetical protein